MYRGPHKRPAVRHKSLHTVRCTRHVGILLLLVAGCDAPAVQDDTASTSSPPAASPHPNDRPGQQSWPAHPPAEAAEAADKSRPANRLARETSPYLLMHAHNPVDWFPWGPEALEKARRENKPIFLSVGYSSCYWCHVMERESFMDEEIATLLNDNFVCIKVDREERPDIDDIYMTAAHLLPPHRGGWPLSVFLTPQAKPFFAGTYFPARAGDRGTGIGFLDVAQRIDGAWREHEGQLAEVADQVAQRIAEELREQAPIQVDAVGPEVDVTVQAALSQQFDPQYGGFGFTAGASHRPKFPSPPNLDFLIERVRRSDDPEARQMLELTLEKMAQGGIRDHLGGGFHRYSTDRQWQIPHFEKMLYDNGQLASIYAEAYALTGREDFRHVAVELLDFVLREMTSPLGGFYAAIDAETDAVEGKFYRWSKEEVDNLLSPQDAELLGDVYGLDGPPNFEHEYYALLLSEPLPVTAERLGIDPGELEAKLARLRLKLLEARNQRPRPLTDTKILTAWNGLMIRGFADSGRILDEPRYVDAAATAADFLLANLAKPDGRLQRTYRDGQAKLNAYLDDYAFLTSGLIALYRATDDDRWLAAARRVTDRQRELFWDEEQGGFFFTSDDHESLIARARQRTDSVLPSGNAVSVRNLVFLGEKFPDESYRQAARQTLANLAGGLDDQRQAGRMPTMALAVMDWLETSAAENNEKE